MNETQSDPKVTRTRPGLVGSPTATAGPAVGAGRGGGGRLCMGVGAPGRSLSPAHLLGATSSPADKHVCQKSTSSPSRQWGGG